MATYSNSPLVNYTAISPNKNTTRVHSTYNPNGVIDKITIHHMAGNLTVETCGNVFAPVSRQASSNYGVGSDGRIGLYVDEEHRAWTSGSAANDYRAVTIEVANDGGESTDWHVSDKAIASLITLCIDICKRNGIKALNWTGTSAGNLTVHNMFQPTSCPGPYLQSKIPYIVQQVNAGLGSKKSNDKIADEVIQGKWGNGIDRVNRLTAAGYDAKAVQAIVDKKLGKTSSTSAATKPATATAVKAGDLVSIKAGAVYYSGTDIPDWVNNAKWYVSSLSGDRAVLGKNEAGTNNIQSPINIKYLTVVTSGAATAKPVASKSTIQIGDVVKMAANAPVYGTATKFSTWVYSAKLYVRDLSGNRAVVSTQKTGAVTGAVDKKYLTKQ